jgi:arabinofuranosyltransferase
MTKAHFVVAAALSAFVFVCVANAWVVDDAYITLRTVDNFIQGYGLRWNVFERVQSYTHPLWMMTMSIVYFITREHYFTILSLGWITTAATLWYTFRATRSAHTEAHLLAYACWVTLLLASKAFMDYSTAGLENPLSHALFAVFYYLLTRTPDPATARVGPLFFIASLSFVNRQDTVLLYLPALGFVLARRVWLRRANSQGRNGWRPFDDFRMLAFATSPAWLWEVFSIVYYGSPFPNTAYAKALNNGIGYDFSITQGSRYLSNSFDMDPITLATVGGAAVTATWLLKKNRITPQIWLMLGCVSYVAYVWLMGAASTHMSGRFLTLVFFVATLIALDALLKQTPAMLSGTLALLLVYQLNNYDAPLRTLGCNWAMQPRDTQIWRGVLDVRRYVCAQGASLANGLHAKRPLPDHDWFYKGLEAKRESEREIVVNLGGADGWGAIGYYGYAAGPRVRIIDRLALADPLLARLPVRSDWSRIAGHYERLIPDGYVESVTTLDNHLVDPKLHQLYDDIRLATQAPLFATGRLDAILRLNTSL